jgi:hypothetical protein
MVSPPKFLFWNLLALLSFGSGSFAEGIATPAAEIAPRWKFSFPTELGKAYQVEGLHGSSGAAGAVWQPVGKVYFGTGTTQEVALLKSELPSDLVEFRVRPVDPSLYGKAPAQLAKGSLTLTEDGISQQFILFNGTSGVAHLSDGTAQGFTWSYHKNDLNAGLAVFTIDPNTVIRITLNFGNETSGRYESIRTHLPSGNSQSDIGIFKLHAELLWETQSKARIPTDLIGKEVLLVTSGEPMKLRFTATQVLRQIGTCVGQLLPYSYDAESVTRGVLTVDLTEGRSEHFVLQANAPSTGTVQRQRLENGVSEAAEPGVFTRTADAVPERSEGIHCAAPNHLENTTLAVSDIVSGVLTLEFDANGEGVKSITEEGSIQQSPFTYGYTRIDDFTAQLITSTPILGGTQVEEITLNYHYEDDCTGTFTRKIYRSGSLYSTTTGTFGPGNPPPAGN